MDGTSVAGGGNCGLSVVRTGPPLVFGELTNRLSANRVHAVLTESREVPGHLALTDGHRGAVIRSLRFDESARAEEFQRHVGRTKTKRC